MSDQNRECEFCEGYVYNHPAMSEGWMIDTCMFIESATDLKKSWQHLVVTDERTNAEAVFNINYCPMCGKEIMHQ